MTKPESMPEYAGMTEPILNQDEDIETFIGHAVGATSACWSNLDGAGVFESVRAAQIVDEILDRLTDLLR